MKVAQWCLILCNTMDYTVHGILLARILEWVAFLFSRGSFQPRDWTRVSPHCRRILYQLSYKGSPRILVWVAYPFSSRFSWPRNWTGSPALQAHSLSTELSGKLRSLFCDPSAQTSNMAQSPRSGTETHFAASGKNWKVTRKRTWVKTELKN